MRRSCQIMFAAALFLAVLSIAHGVESWEIAVYDGASTADNRVDSGGTPFPNHVLTGQTVHRTFLIRNNGTETLRALRLSSQTTSAANWTVSAPKKTTLAPRSSTTFTVTYRAGQAILPDDQGFSDTINLSLGYDQLGDLPLFMLGSVVLEQPKLPVANPYNANNDAVVDLTSPDSQPVTPVIWEAADTRATGPVKYQWLKDGQPIAGATRRSYRLSTPIEASDGGIYSVRITTPYGHTEQILMRLAVLTGFIDREIRINEGASLDLSSTIVHGFKPVSWFLNDSALPNDINHSGTGTTHLHCRVGEEGIYAMRLAGNLLTGGRFDAYVATFHVTTRKAPVFDSNFGREAYSAVVGEAMNLEIPVSAASTCSGSDLPPGLRITHQRMAADDSHATAWTRWAITGTPTKAGNWEMKLRATRYGLSSSEIVVTFMIYNFSSVYVGTYVGSTGALPFLGSGQGFYTSSDLTTGQISLTISSNGRFTGHIGRHAFSGRMTYDGYATIRLGRAFDWNSRRYLPLWLEMLPGSSGAKELTFNTRLEGLQQDGIWFSLRHVYDASLLPLPAELQGRFNLSAYSDETRAAALISWNVHANATGSAVIRLSDGHVVTTAGRLDLTLSQPVSKAYGYQEFSAIAIIGTLPSSTIGSVDGVLTLPVQPGRVTAHAALSWERHVVSDPLFPEGLNAVLIGDGYAYVPPRPDTITMDLPPVAGNADFIVFIDVPTSFETFDLQGSFTFSPGGRVQLVRQDANLPVRLTLNPATGLFFGSLRLTDSQLPITRAATFTGLLYAAAGRPFFGDEFGKAFFLMRSIQSPPYVKSEQKLDVGQFTLLRRTDTSP